MATAGAVRPARLEDASAIAALCADLGYPVPLAELRARLERSLDSDRMLVLVAVVPGRGVLGWLGAERRTLLESGERVEITGLVVAEHARRSGIGARLVEEARHWAVRIGVPRLRVRSDVTRRVSHAFYQALGFERKKTQHVYDTSVAVDAQR